MSTEEIPQQQQEQPSIIPEQIYIGNVDYQLTEDELKEFLSDYEFESVEIPHKQIKRKGEVVETGRGHAFALFKTVEEAQRALTELNDKEFKGRKIYTKQALPVELRPKKAPVEKATKKKAPKTKKKPISSSTSEDPEKDEEVVAEEKNETKSTKPKKPVNGRVRPPKVPLSEGIPSQDTIFINNLNFEVTDEELKEFFAKFEPTWVDIPKKSLKSHVYRTLKKQNVPIRGRGIGFVRFASQDLQKQAVEEMNGKEFKGREITVSIAIDSNIKSESPAKEEEEEEEVKEPSPVNA